MRRLVADKDFLAGTLYMTFGFLGLWLGRGLEAGSAEAMGAGYFPRLICALLVIVGAALAALSAVRGGQCIERGKLRPFALVTLSCLAFALLLYPLGLVLTLVVSIVLACLADASSRIRAVPLILLCLILIGANVGIFVVGLRIAIPLWPAAF